MHWASKKVQRRPCLLLRNLFFRKCYRLESTGEYTAFRLLWILPGRSDTIKPFVCFLNGSPRKNISKETVNFGRVCNCRRSIAKLNLKLSLVKRQLLTSTAEISNYRNRRGERLWRNSFSGTGQILFLIFI